MDKEKIIALRRQGLSYNEIAAEVGVCKADIGKLCRKNNLGGAIKVDTYSSRETNAKQYIEKHTPWFEYVGGFTTFNGFVTIRCRRCGYEEVRSFCSIKQGTASCDRCKEKEKEDRAARKAQAEEAERIARVLTRHNRQIQKAIERAEWIAERKHPCVVCGKETTNRYCCSIECSNKRNNQIKEVRRRAKLKEALIDKGITLQALYERDNGVCYICGDLCDWGDKKETPVCVLCGDRYPSIDHVVPLVKGGKHEWVNVRLAHRICNTIKRYTYLPRGQVS